MEALLAEKRLTSHFRAARKLGGSRRAISKIANF
jgi:hypothetical protein